MAVGLVAMVICLVNGWIGPMIVAAVLTVMAPAEVMRRVGE